MYFFRIAWASAQRFQTNLYGNPLFSVFCFCYTLLMKNIPYKTLSERTADLLSDYLYSNNYRVGAKLPNELRLAEQFEVSRATIRQAIRLLCERNILEVERGSGTFVSSRMGLSEDPLGLSMITDRKKLVMDSMELRLMIEPPLSALAAENATSEEILHLNTLCQKLEEACRNGENYYSLDTEFHTFVAGCSRNLVIHSLYPAISQTILLQESMLPNRFGSITAEAHRSIYEAIRTHRATEAYSAMQMHLLRNKQRLLEHFRN